MWLSDTVDKEVDDKDDDEYTNMNLCFLLFQFIYLPFFISPSLENEQLLQLLPSPIADKYKRFLASLQSEEGDNEHLDLHRGSIINRFSIAGGTTLPPPPPRSTRTSAEQAIAALEASEKVDGEVGVNRETSDGGVSNEGVRESMRILKDAPLGSGLVYTQRAIVVLGHYPFYHAFSEFLTQLYHASLGEYVLYIFSIHSL
jgi:hypothetical protein